ncbi:GntR family transcriptional regulator [Sanguibacter gelidistatuariae]|uniref:GntR family transcriptional regulator n=1 Tax=Sanguibacter gelidistatuariae TaxID=1814289 RepID=A0A1G6N9Y4_9MICO|nr:GntR family transcriptional regulator [Sanguibacter gelidistatuariae]SDC64682.1 GntR family transcriptional regulator [Sanguibacter gelidistatuariae]
MLFRIDPSAPEPLFAQLASQVRLAAARGELDAGERLPAARDLAESLDLNVHTVLRAYQDLRDEGLIDLRRGRGAVVTERASADYAALRAALAVVVHEAHALNLSPDTTLALLKEALA